MTLLSDGFTGSVLKNLSKENLSNIEIKIPKLEKKIQDLEITFQQIETLQNEVKILEELYKQYIQELTKEAIITVF